MKNQLTPNQHYILYCCKNNIKIGLLYNTKSEVVLLQKAGFLDKDFKLTERAEKSLENLSEVFRKTKSNVSEKLMGLDYLSHVVTFRDYFPKLKKSTPAEVKTKFAKLFLENPGLQWDKLFLATELYFSEDREEKYIYKASNFIMVQRGGINTYPILEYYERIENGEKPVEKGDVNMYKIY